MWKVGLVWLLFNASVISFTTWSLKIFEDFMKMDPFYSNLLAITLMLVAIPCVPIFGLISDRIDKRKPFMILGSMLMAILFTVIAYTSGAVMITSIVILGIVAASIPPIVNSLSPEIMGPNLAGTGFGILGICLNIGIAIAPPIIGLLLDRTESTQLSFLGIASFSILGVAISYSLRTK